MNPAAVLIPPSLDAKQALRLRRFGVAALSYVLATALVAIAWMFGVLPGSIVLETAAAFVAMNLGLYAVIRSGLNLRFEDPSLTRLQILSAITILMYIVYHMDDGRDIALFGCFIVFQFGVVRLRAREFVVVTLYTLAAYALVIDLLMQFRPEAIRDAPGEWMSWLGLAGFLPCLNIVSGQINALRRRMRDSEARFRSLSEMSSDFYWESDAEHRLSERASADLRRKNRPEFQEGPRLGERRWEIPYLSPGEAGWQSHRAMLDAHLPFRNFELSRLEADGSERYTSISGDPVFDASNGFMGYRGVGTDITARKRSRQLLKLEHSVARALADADASADALNAVMRTICHIEGWECGRYFRVDENADVMRFEEAWCIDDPAARAFVEGSRGIAFQRGKGLSGIAWETGQPVWSADASTDPRVSQGPLTRAAGTHGAVAFPVFADGKAIGVFAFSSARVRAPEERQLDAFKVIGAQVGQFVRRKQAEHAARESAEELRLFADNVPAMTVSWDEKLHCRFVNTPYVRFFGTTVVDTVGKHLREIVGEKVYLEIEGHFARALQGHPVTYQRVHRPEHGEPRSIEIRVLPNIDDREKVVGLFSVIIDITEHKLAEQRIQHVADHDSLTGLPNRLLFNDRLMQAIALAKRDTRQFALLYLDLDKFKPVNDSLGHAAGDELLKGVAARIRRQVREADTVARVGGDEFTVILTDVGGRAAAEMVARKIIAALAAPFELGSRKRSIDIGASVGIAIYPADARTADALVRVADAAMYSAKQAERTP